VKPDDRKFRVTFAALDRTLVDAPPGRRLARMLKAALRSFGFRVVLVEELPPRPHADGGAGTGDR
jgi:hypothetical protein